jgi:hypothetical protein
MAHFSRRTSAAVSGRLRRLDRRLGIDHRGRSEWIWAVPVLSFAGTLAMVLVLGVVSHVPALVSAPIAVVAAVVIAGQSVAYMTPGPDTGGDDRDRRHGPDEPKPPGPDQPDPADQVVPAWYRQLAKRTVEEPAPRRSPHRHPQKPRS